MKPIALGLIGLLGVNGAWCLDLGDNVTLKGFGTLGIATSDNSQADYIPNQFFHPNGVGASAHVTPNLDSKVGLQLDWQATSFLAFGAQAISQQSPSGNYKPTLAWAFAALSVRSDLTVRAGLLRPPTYLLSDYLDVNYANPWVRPPVEFYFTDPLTKLEGVDFLWKPQLGGVSLLIQPFYGIYPLTQLSPGNGNLRASGEAGINVSASRDALTVRVGYAKDHLTSHNPPVDDQILPALAAICGLGDPVACSQDAALTPYGKFSSFASLGVSYDDGVNFASAEVGRRVVDTEIVGNVDTWYVSGGRRFGKWMPYATYSTYISRNPVSFSGGNFQGNAQYQLPSTNDVVNFILDNEARSQHSTTFGVRYDVMADIALKGQWDIVQTVLAGGQAGTGYGLFANYTPAFGITPMRVNVFSATLDFAF